MKAFLQGEQHLRRAEWDSALAYYERAIALDSSFAPALRRASTAREYLRPARRRPNLRIETEALATRVLLDGQRAVGAAYLQHGVEVNQLG